MSTTSRVLGRLGARQPSAGSARPRMERFLLANLGGPFRDDVIDEAARLANEHGATVSVLQILRIWGTGLGLPHPALQPNRHERIAASDALEDACAALERLGATLSGRQVIKTRKPAKIIAAEASRLGSDLVLVGVPQGRLRRELTWEGQAVRIGRHTRVPVRLVVDGAET